MILTTLIAFVASTLGSLFSLILWFHFDIEGYVQQKRHQRAMRIGRKDEERMRKHRSR